MKDKFTLLLTYYILTINWFKVRVILFAACAVSLISYIIYNEISSQKKIEDVRKVHVGETTKQLQIIMGKPDKIIIQAGYEEWCFYYYFESKRIKLIVDVENNKVINFNSY